MRDKKILIINNGLAGGGIERASVSLANHFSGVGYELHVVALYKSEPFFSRETINRYLYVIKMILYLRANIKRTKPDVILAFGEWTNPFVVIASMGLKVPMFLSDRMSPVIKLPFVSALLRKHLYKKATGIVAQTEYAKMIYHRNFQNVIEAEQALFNHIEVYYNRRRKHSTNGYKSPAQYEMDWWNNRKAA